MKAASRRNPWLVVAGCAIALSTGSTAVMNLTFSQFIQPITTEFGWPRSLLSAGLSAYLLAMAACLPLAGRIIDRYGTWPALPFAASLFAVSLAMIGVCPESPVIFIALFVLAGALGSSLSPIPYAIVISSWFDARRGLALGLALGGSGAGAMLLPHIARALIDEFGWRTAYLGLGGLVFVVAVPAIILFVSMSPRTPQGEARKAQPDAAAAPGLSLHQALRQYSFWAIAISALFVALTANGTLAHLAPLLAARGIPAGNVASMLSVLGVAVLVGRLGAGYVLDRVFAPFVAAGTITVVLIGHLLLWSELSGMAPLVAVACLGFGLGAEFDIFGYLASRYFGLQRFGEIFGTLSMIYAVASAVGPIAMGASYDIGGSYGMALLGFAALMPIGIVMITRLGPYPYPAQPNSDAPRTTDPSAEPSNREPAPTVGS